jgi:hypothetical protein
MDNTEKLSIVVAVSPPAFSPPFLLVSVVDKSTSILISTNIVTVSIYLLLASLALADIGPLFWN